MAKRIVLFIEDRKADQGMYVNFIGDKYYIFCFSQIHPSRGCTLREVMANRHTATNDGTVEKRLIEIPKVLSLDLSDYKNPQPSIYARLGICLYWLSAVLSTHLKKFIIYLPTTVSKSRIIADHFICSSLSFSKQYSL